MFFDSPALCISNKHTKNFEYNLWIVFSDFHFISTFDVGRFIERLLFRTKANNALANVIRLKCHVFHGNHIHPGKNGVSYNSERNSVTAKLTVIHRSNFEQCCKYTMAIACVLRKDPTFVEIVRSFHLLLGGWKMEAIKLCIAYAKRFFIWRIDKYVYGCSFIPRA